MNRSFRRYVALLLLALLPFQAMASGLVALEKTMHRCCADMHSAGPMLEEAGMSPTEGPGGCCDHGSDAAPDNCANALGCLALTPPALMGPAAFALPAPQRIAAVVAVRTLHDSHIPEGLQRPPCLPA